MSESGNGNGNVLLDDRALIGHEKRHRLPHLRHNEGILRLTSGGKIFEDKKKSEFTVCMYLGSIN